MNVFKQASIFVKTVFKQTLAICAPHILSGNRDVCFLR